MEYQPILSEAAIMRHALSISFAWLALGTSLHAQENLISKDARQAIDAGLAFLAKEQANDGSWGAGQYKGSVAVTSLAGLAFLAGNHAPDRGDFGKAVTRAIRYVLRSEHKDTAGFFQTPTATHGPMYDQGFAALFLADAHAAISDAKLKKEVNDALTRAVKLILESQNAQGGWRYRPRPADADLSNTVCQVMALRAARDEGIGVPRTALDGAIAYIKSCQQANDGGFRYMPQAGASGYARTAAGLAALDRLGVQSGDVIDNGLKYLRKADRKNDIPTLHYLYAHYYAGKALWLTNDTSLPKWYAAVRDELLENRRGNHWAQIGAGITDPHYCTAMALNILQTPSGHLASMAR
jgi:prenyltransferase beta subunit